MKNRTNYLSGSKYENSIGFSRAVKVGNIITVAGTAPIGEDGKTAGINDVAVQTERCLEIIKAALEQAGASLSDVVKTRIFMTNVEDWEKAGVVHGKYFSDIKPATIFMEVSRFISSEWLVEIEAEAIISE
ncbi:MAG: RidA family protein [bacterium]